MGPEKIDPLTADLLNAVPKAGWLERALAPLPLLCGLADCYSLERHSEVEKACKDRVAARPEIPLDLWGDSEVRHHVAKVVCEKTREGMGWPNGRFIPDDSVLIVFYFGVYDCLDGVDTINAIFDELGIVGPFYLLDPVFENCEATMRDLVIACEQLYREN